MAHRQEQYLPGALFPFGDSRSLPGKKPVVAGRGSGYAKTTKEKRIDSVDGKAYTLDEISKYYCSQYTQSEIASYWEGMKPVVHKKSKGRIQHTRLNQARANIVTAVAPTGAEEEAVLETDASKDSGKSKGSSENDCQNGATKDKAKAKTSEDEDCGEKAKAKAKGGNEPSEDEDGGAKAKGKNESSCVHVVGSVSSEHQKVGKKICAPMPSTHTPSTTATSTTPTSAGNEMEEGQYEVVGVNQALFVESPRWDEVNQAQRCLTIFEQLAGRTDDKTFKELCHEACLAMKEGTSDSWGANELGKLGEILLLLLKKLVEDVEEKCEERWTGTLQLMEAFGERQEWLQASLHGTTISDLIAELLRLVNKLRRLLNAEVMGPVGEYYSLAETETWIVKLKVLNLLLVTCMRDLPSAAAYRILLGILKDDEETCSSWVVNLCLKKIYTEEKKMHKRLLEACKEKQARSAMEVVLSSRQSVVTMTNTARRQAWIDGAKVVVKIARAWLSEAVDDCFYEALVGTTSAEDQTLLKEIMVLE